MDVQNFKLKQDDCGYSSIKIETEFDSNYINIEKQRVVLICFLFGCQIVILALILLKLVGVI